MAVVALLENRNFVEVRGLSSWSGRQALPRLAPQAVRLPGFYATHACNPANAREKHLIFGEAFRMTILLSATSNEGRTAWRAFRLKLDHLWRGFKGRGIPMVVLPRKV
ncbi:hypothetical protein [Bradyrhizobium acaciae]|uniref:hypothetical protein n=1 Tax=Bradyrhizobium acaciae TaxID=2683706 RepID=UPI001E3EE06D|nr:hypothetical protein [Bradyrhizobium acaciae]MCC8977936.1 hypothetical protein [Bradyrhizobium acaciae]